MIRSISIALILMLAGEIASAADSPPPFLSPIFGDNMVLQRDKPNTIWGWSKPGDVVEVKLAGRTARAVTDADGKWQVRLDPPAPGGPYTIEINGPQRIVLHEVLVGDVWLCGGQSNMQLELAHARDGSNEVAQALHPELRLFVVASRSAYSPVNTVQGSWKVCTPQSVSENGGFSAVAYYFGRRIQQDIHVPVGLVEDCLGGTPAEAWSSPEALRTLGDFDAGLAEVDRLRKAGAPEYGNYVMHWYDEYDLGLKGNWSAADFNDSDWKTVPIPGGFKELGVPDAPAVCWFRREVTLPDPLPPGPAHLQLGIVQRMDTAYINGHWLGGSAWVENPRNYMIHAGDLKPGANVLAVRVFKTLANGGFVSQPDALKLVLGNGQVIPLAGDWKGALSVDARPPHPMPMGFENWPVMPSVLYRGMLQPLAPLALTGAIWYQGEANADRAWQYRRVLPAMITDWRRLFDQGDFPFYIVSLPAFMPHRDVPGDDAWAELREAQAFTASSVKNTGLAVTIDTGEADNIHPKDKRIVGERLAYAALAQTYHEKIPFQGPTFKSMNVDQGTVTIHFAHTEGGLTAKDGAPREFSVAGADRQWHWADAKIVGDTVVLSSAAVPQPEAVRYAWQSNPQATLYNGAGLPAVPFRTDNWPGLTQPKK